MTKAEIVKQIARETGVEAVAVTAVVEEFMKQVRGALATKENVYCAVSEPFLSSTARRKQPVILRRIQRSLFRSTTSRPLSRRQILKRL